MKLDSTADSPSPLPRRVQTMEGISRLTRLWGLPGKDQRPAVDSGTTWTSAGLWFPGRKYKRTITGRNFQILAAHLKINKFCYLK